jgi:hypothetical protein
LVEGFALRGARKGADDFGKSIKRAVEASSTERDRPPD